jgi:hypothetical protein
MSNPGAWWWVIYVRNCKQKGVPPSVNSVQFKKGEAPPVEDCGLDDLRFAFYSPNFDILWLPDRQKEKRWKTEFEVMMLWCQRRGRSLASGGSGSARDVHLLNLIGYFVAHIQVGGGSGAS